MPQISTRERAGAGIWLNGNALDKRTRMQFAKMVGAVLKEAGNMSILPELVIPNPLPAAHGLDGKFVAWTDLVAAKKPEGSQTEIQRPELKEGVTYRLEQWEEVIGITDEAKINGQLGAQDLLNAGNAAKGFARAIDADGLAALYGLTPTAASGDWSTATDQDIIDDIGGAVDSIETGGFDPTHIILDRNQWLRISNMEWVINTSKTATDYLNQVFGLKVVMSRKISYVDSAGTRVDMFDPVDKVMIMDKAGYAVWSQRPTTIELERDVSRGVDLAYMRKFFKTVRVQDDAAVLLDGIVI